MPVPDPAIADRAHELLAEYGDDAFAPLDLNARFPFSIFRGSKGCHAVIPASEHPDATVGDFFDLIVSRCSRRRGQAPSGALRRARRAAGRSA